MYDVIIPATYAKAKRMELGFLKPILTTMIMPLMLCLTVAVLALVIFCLKGAGRVKNRSLQWQNGQSGKTGQHSSRGKKYLCLSFFFLSALWPLSCHGTAVMLSRWLLPPTTALASHTLNDLKGAHQAGLPMAIVVLGAGAQPHAAEYDGEQALSPYALERLVYGVHLAQKTQIPLAYSGEQGWAQHTPGTPEAQAAMRTAQEMGTPLRWVDAASRDTQQNDTYTAAMLHAENIKHVILVTQAWHMPRAMRAFEKSGFNVTPAPVGFITPYSNAWLEWLPSSNGLRTTSIILREWMGLQVQRFGPA